MNYTFMSEYTLYRILKDSANQEITEYLGGYHIKIDYPNGYGASIVKHDSSYGNSEDLWELAVLHNSDISYKNSITNDVVGYLNEDEVAEICDTIRGWDQNGKPTGGWSYEEECEYYYYIFTTNYEWEEQVQEGIELYKEYQEELDDE